MNELPLGWVQERVSVLAARRESVFWVRGEHDKRHRGEKSECVQTEKSKGRGFPAGPVAKIPCSQGRGHKFDPWLGN